MPIRIARNASQSAREQLVQVVRESKSANHAKPGKSSLAANPEKVASRSEQLPKVNVALPTLPVEIDVSSVLVLGRRRPLNFKIVDALAKNIEERGLQYPIDIYPLNGIAIGKYGLVAGAHRLAAFEKLGRPFIPARILSRDQRFAWRELENLLRAELTVLERSESLVVLTKKINRSGASTAGGDQPHDKGFSEVARITGYSRKLIGEAHLHCSIPGRLREQIRKLEQAVDNRSLLTKIARMNAAEQVGFVDQLATSSPESNKKPRKKESGNAACLQTFGKDANLKRLSVAWSRSAFKAIFDKESLSIQRSFLQSLLDGVTKTDAKG